MTVSELIDRVYIEAHAEWKGNVADIAKNLGVAESTARARMNAIGLPLGAGTGQRPPKPTPEEAKQRVLERLRQGSIPYFGSPAQDELLRSGEARLVQPGPYSMLEFRQ